MSNRQVQIAAVMASTSEARVELHRLSQKLHKALRMVDESERRDHLYKMAGDLIESIPGDLDKLSSLINKANLALSSLNVEFDSDLSMDDRSFVEDSMDSDKVARILTARYVKKIVGRHES